MATWVGKEKDLPKLLCNLIELDFDAIEAYDAAIRRLEHKAYKDQLAKFMADHQQHVQALSVQARRLGADPPTGADIKQVLTKGKVVIAALAGDKAILKAMKSNEDETNTAYERAVGHANISAEVSTLLERNLTDERIHRSWIEQSIRDFPIEPSAPITTADDMSITSEYPV